MKKETNQFPILRKGGYSPPDVDAYVGKLQTEVAGLKQKLEQTNEALAHAHANEKGEGVQLYDPENATVRLLAAAQAAADKMIHDAKADAREKVANYFQEQKAAIENQKALYDKEKADLVAKFANVHRLKKELENEVTELLEQSKFKMSVIAQTATEFEDVLKGTTIAEPTLHSDAVSKLASGPSVDSSLVSETISDAAPATGSPFSDLQNENLDFSRSMPTEVSPEILPAETFSAEIPSPEQATEMIPEETKFPAPADATSAESMSVASKEGEEIAEPEPTEIYSPNPLGDPLVTSETKADSVSLFKLTDKKAPAEENTGGEEVTGELTSKERKWAQDILEASN